MKSQVIGMTLEELFVGQDRQARGAVLRIAAGDVGGLEVRTQHALGRRRLFHFSDDGGVAGADLVAHCLGKAAGAECAVVAVGFRFGTHAGEVAVLARGGHFFGLHGQDFLQDVGHIRL
jgi:hypothetical protein